MQKKKKKTRKKNNRFKYFFFSIIFCYLLIKLVSIANSSANSTEIAEYGKIEIANNLECYIVRNERRVHSDLEGKIKYFVKEGEKVEKGYKILEIHKGVVEESVKGRLALINQKIQALQENSSELIGENIYDIDKDIASIVDDIKKSQEQGELFRLGQLENELKGKLEKKNIITGDNIFDGKDLEDLKIEQEALISKINNAISYIKSPISGIISYNIDGYESIFSPQNMTTMELNKTKKLKDELTDLRGTNAIKNQPLFKVVDDSLWYIVTWVDDKILPYYKNGKKVTFKLQDDKVEGMVCKIIENRDESMIIFALDEYAPNFYNIRKANLEVVSVNYEGLKIHMDSIVERDEKQGVYVLDINRQACFKPVKLIGHDDEYAIIQNNVFYEGEGDNQEAIPTVRLYDEVVRNARNIKEGQIVY